MRTHVRVLRDQRLVLLELRPADVARVMVGEQDRPALPGDPMPRGRDRAPLVHARAMHRAPEGVRPRVDRVAQDAEHVVVGGHPPLGRQAARPHRHHRERHRFGARPPEDLPDAAQLLELPENEAHRLDDARVRIKLEPPTLAPDVAGWEAEAQLAALGLGVARRGAAPARPRCRSRLSSYSDIVPLRPNSRRSFTSRGS